MKLLPFLKRVGFKEKGVMVYIYGHGSQCQPHVILYLFPPSLPPSLFTSDVHFMPVSGYNGTNLKEIDCTCCPFYNGPSFLSYLDTLNPLSREDGGPVRMPILDRFKVNTYTT